MDIQNQNYRENKLHNKPLTATKSRYYCFIKALPLQWLQARRYSQCQILKLQ